VVSRDGVAAALAEAAPAERAAAQAWLRGGGGLAGTRRLEVYATAYFERILGVLAECFPALRAGLGEELFHDLVTSYLLAHPPFAPSIRRAGEALPEFLAHEPGGAPFRRRAAFAADLALLERALLDAFDAAGAEPLAREALAELPPERWAWLRLRFAPSAQLLRLAWPVERLRAAQERGEAPPPLAPQESVLLVWRRGERALRRALDPLEAGALEAARAGEPFAALCERIAAARGEAAAPGLAAGLVERWLADELVCGLG
jgi:hypothetical protein